MSHSKKALAVDHCFVTNIEIKFCLCDVVCGRGGLFGLQREGRRFSIPAELIISYLIKRFCLGASDYVSLSRAYISIMKAAVCGVN